MDGSLTRRRRRRRRCCRRRRRCCRRRRCVSINAKFGKFFCVCCCWPLEGYPFSCFYTTVQAFLLVFLAFHV